MLNDDQWGVPRLLDGLARRLRAAEPSDIDPQDLRVVQVGSVRLFVREGLLDGPEEEDALSEEVQ